MSIFTLATIGLLALSIGNKEGLDSARAAYLKTLERCVIVTAVFEDAEKEQYPDWTNEDAESYRQEIRMLREDIPVLKNKIKKKEEDFEFSSKLLAASAIITGILFFIFFQ